jgi:hypothetical protein
VAHSLTREMGTKQVQRRRIVNAKSQVLGGKSYLMESLREPHLGWASVYSHLEEVNIKQDL